MHSRFFSTVLFKSKNLVLWRILLYFDTWHIDSIIRHIKYFVWWCQSLMSITHDVICFNCWALAQNNEGKKKGSIRAAQYQYFPINSISIILFVFLSIPISISIIFKRAYQYQYFINYSKNFLINFNINTS